MQEFALGYRWAPWTDLLRVDVLNILGLSMMLMGALCRVTASRSTQHSGDGTEVAASGHNAIVGGVAMAAIVALLSPLLWTTWRPRWLPWPLESYFNGVHIFNQPQPWLFPLFPWSAFAFAGLAVGFFLFSDVAKRNEALVFGGLGGIGVLACIASVFFDHSAVHWYPPAIYDYWHTSPNFFLMRIGILLAMLFCTYGWCRWGLAQKGFSPFIQLGTTSLLVYWVHIEFVYGRFSILPKSRCGLAKTTAGLLTIFLAMLLLSILRTSWKKRIRAWHSEPAAVAAPAESG
jgi:hypothetical protein